MRRFAGGRDRIRMGVCCMPKFDYVILGGGMTAAAAVRGVRELDRSGSIAVVGTEPHPPYARPPLSKGLWKDAKLESIWLPIDDLNVELHQRRTVQKIDTGNRSLTDDQGTTYSYGKLLYATGGTPKRLPFGGDSVIYYRTLNDYHQLRGLADQKHRFAVIGGGFIGSEIAAALAMNQRPVSMIFPGAAIASHMVPADLAEFLNGYYREKGVEVLSGEEVKGIETRDEETTLTLKSGRKLVVNDVVAGLGIKPNVELAKAAGLEGGDGGL